MNVLLLGGTGLMGIHLSQILELGGANVYGIFYKLMY